MKLLTDKQFKSTFLDPMKEVTGSEPPFDFWDYFDSIPKEDTESYDFSEEIISYVYRSADSSYDHVSFSCEVKNVFLVLILDLNKKEVFGHKILDLNKEYGLTT